MNLKQLYAKLAELQKSRKAILDGATDGELTEDQSAEFDRIGTEIETVSANIKRLESLARTDSFLNESPGRVTIPEQPGATRIETPVTTERERAWAGFRDAADFGRAVRSACSPSGSTDERLGRMYAAPSDYHRENVGSDGGFLVPPGMRDEIWSLVFGEDDLLNTIDLEPTESNQVEFQADEWTPWGGTGVLAKWRNEASQMTPTKSTTDPRYVKLHELYAFCLSTDELLEDAPRLNNRLTVKASAAIRYKASDAILYGTGVGQPLGFFNASSRVSVAKESGQAADTIQAENVAKMLSRLLGGGSPRTFWLANSDCIPQIMTMTIGTQPIWTPPSEGFKQAPGGFLLGRPIKLSEHAKTVGDQGDIQLIDPTGYYGLRKTAGLKADSSIHLYFDYGITAFRWTFRFGGQPFLSAAVSPDNGSNTKSHYVVLDARA